MKNIRQSISNLIQLIVRHRRFLLVGLISLACLTPFATQWRQPQNVQAAALPLAACGTKSVGPGGDYATLTAAFADLNASGVSCQVVLELQADYTSGGETFPLQLNQIVGSNAANTITIRPQAGASGVIITTGAAGTFYLNGTDFVIFDGRPGGVGGAKELTIENTQTNGGIALALFNSATNNQVQYCNLKGSNQFENGGVIYFCCGANDNNKIDRCDIGNSGAGLPHNLVYGHDIASSDGITVSNSNLFNFFPGSAVRAAGNGFHTNWTVSGNHIYQEAARSGSFDQRAIRLDNATFGVFTVTDNVIGYAAADETGTYTLAGSLLSTFTGISIQAGTATPSVVQGNKIANIALTGARNRFRGIAAAQGNINVNNNTIGSPADVDNIVNTGTATGGDAIPLTVGIYCSTGTQNITNNRVGGFTLRGDAPNKDGSFAGIYADTGTKTFFNNVIGSQTVADSIRCGDVGTTGGCSLTGMLLGGFVDAATYSSNTIANFKNNSTRADIRGILGSAGTIIVSDNLIHDLSSFGDLGPNNFPAVLAGMEISGGTGNITLNTVHSLANTNPAASNSTLAGIYLDKFVDVGGNATVERNFVHSLSRAATGIPVSGDGIAMKGIFVFQAADRFVVRNNMVRLGIDANGSSVTSAMLMAGIMIGSISPNAQVYFNSVYLGGAGVGTSVGNADTYAFRGDSANPRDFRDNIFVNARSNAGTGAKHYAYWVSTTPPTSDYNLYLASGVGGILAKTGATDRTTLGALQGALPGQDFNSLAGDPFFVNPLGTAGAVNLHILASVCGPAADAGTPLPGLTIDFDGQTRHATNPDIGADEFIPNPPAIVVQPQPMQNVCVGAPATFSVAAIGAGVLTYQWRKNGSNISGANGSTFNIAGAAEGDAGSYDVVVTQTCGLTVSSAISTTAALTVKPATNITAPPSAREVCFGSAMHVPFAVTATGSNLSYVWTIDGNTIGGNAAGMTVDASVLTAGNHAISVTVTGDCSAPLTATATLTVNPGISFTPTALPDGTVGVPYAPTSFSATGGNGSITFSMTEGSLPNGMSLVSGQLAGTPTQSGTFTFTIAATDGTCSASRNYTVAVNCPTIVVSPETIPIAQLDVAYPTQTFTASAGSDPYTFSLSGTLPAGMGFTGATLSGTPTQHGDFPVTINVTDRFGCAMSRAYILRVNRSPIARCKDVTVSAGSGSTVAASIDDGSFDPDDGDTIALAQAPPGPYPIGTTPVTLTVTDSRGGASSCTAIVAVTETTQILGDFVAFSRARTRLGANTKVFSGSVGSNASLLDQNGGQDDKEEVEIGAHVQMLQAGSRVVGDTVLIRADAGVYDVHYNELNAIHANILGTQVTPLPLPVLTLPPLPAITPGTQDIEVLRDQTMTLAPGSYRKLTVNHQGTLILTGGIYHISSLDLRQKTKLYFAGPAEVRIKDEMDTDFKAYIGPGPSAQNLQASQIVFYVEGNDDQGRRHDGDENLGPTAVRVGEQNTLLINIYAPNGTVWLKTKTAATGAFIGNAVRIGEGVELKLKSAF